MCKWLSPQEEDIHTYDENISQLEDRLCGLQTTADAVNQGKLNAEAIFKHVDNQIKEILERCDPVKVSTLLL